MSKINVEIGLCTKDMAKENPIKDFEILIEEYKDKWSTQMYDYFKECLNEIKEKEKALEIIIKKKVNLEYLKCCKNYEQYKTVCSYWNEITEQEFDLLKRFCYERNNI